MNGLVQFLKRSWLAVVAILEAAIAVERYATFLRDKSLSLWTLAPGVAAITLFALCLYVVFSKNRLGNSSAWRFGTLIRAVAAVGVLSIPLAGAVVAHLARVERLTRVSIAVARFTSVGDESVVHQAIRDRLAQLAPTCPELSIEQLTLEIPEDATSASTFAAKHDIQADAVIWGMYYTTPAVALVKARFEPMRGVRPSLGPIPFDLTSPISDFQTLRVHHQVAHEMSALVLLMVAVKRLTEGNATAAVQSIHDAAVDTDVSIATRAQLHLWLAKAYLELGDVTNARVSLEAANAAKSRATMDLNRRMREWQNAVRKNPKLVRPTDERLSQMHQSFGLFFESSGEYRDAYASYQRAIEFSDRDDRRLWERQDSLLRAMSLYTGKVASLQ